MAALIFNKVKKLTNTNLLWLKYVIAFTAGLALGYRAIPFPVVYSFYFFIIGLCAWYGYRNKLDKMFVWLPIACYLEAYIRGYMKNIPYLALQYFFIILFGYLIIKNIRKAKAHNYAFVLLIIYGIVDCLQSVFPDDPSKVKDVLIPNLALVAIAVWASFNRLNPFSINRLLTYFKIASVFLTGIVLVAHLQGGITYNTESNFGSSNGLAPVQLSGYLGFGSILLLLSFFNPEELLYRPLNMILFVLNTTVMVLTFSRGGLYFIIVIMALFMYFKRANFMSYFKIIFLIPLGWGIYNFAVKQTGGQIVKRYEDKGTSHRDELVTAGFKIFLDEPIIGVGTSNYSTQAFKRGYYYQVSTAHNEFIRAIAEHGIIGMITYWGYFIWTFFIIFKRHGIRKEFSVYFFTLFCLIIVHNGLKISIQHVLILMAVGNPDVIIHRIKANRFIQTAQQKILLAR